MIGLRKNLYQMSPFLKYLFYSIIVTIIDVVIVWVLHDFFNIHIIIANTTGVISGFLIHYLLSSKAVFSLEYGAMGFIIYLGTFIYGLVFADILIYVGKYYLFARMQDEINFLFSKGLSIIVPFFILYYLRKFLFEVAKRKYSN